MSAAVLPPAPCECGCDAPAGETIHRVLACLRRDDIDGAIESGLLEFASPCGSCSPGCAALVQTVRDERLAALAARDRFRSRTARLGRRAAERAARRSTVVKHRPPTDADAAPRPVPALPPAAAALA
ncbi:MAG: hypothetical protein M3Q42_13450, partial [Pseudomonadota bacterium]|nr:hypothetical protein [Pseudomonadota bacterium]